MKKVITGSVLAIGVGMAGLFGAGAASADVTNNGTLNDAMGFAVANDIHNFHPDENGAGYARAGNKGSISEIAGRNRVTEACGECTAEQGDQNDADSDYQPISNNDPTKVGNGRVLGNQ